MMSRTDIESTYTRYTAFGKKPVKTDSVPLLMRALLKSVFLFWISLVSWIWFVQYMDFPSTDAPLKKFVYNITYQSRSIVTWLTFRPLKTSPQNRE